MSSQTKKWNFHYTLGLPPSTGMREALQWLMLARLGILYIVLGVIVLGQIFRKEQIGHSPILGYALLSVSFGFNLFHSLLIEKLNQHWWVAITHILFDAAVTSAWIYLSGNNGSLFALMYLIQILAVALTLFQKGALVSAVVSSLFLAFVSSSNLEWGIYTGIFLMLGIVGGYLSEELLRTTERLKEKNRTIERLTELHDRIIANMPTGLLTIDKNMRINFINPAAEHILNRVARDVVGKHLGEVEAGLLPFFTQIESEEMEVADVAATGTEHHRALFMHSKSSTARLQQTVEIGRGASLRILRGDVAELDPAAALGRLLDQEVAGGRVLLFQDVTKLLNLEDKLKQNEKLAAVGQLAAGIAHEIRNPLASMSASIEMLKSSRAHNNSEDQKLMDIAIREIDRLNRLISEFLDFVKPEKLKFESVDLQKLLGEILVGVRNSKDMKPATKIVEKYTADVCALASSEKLKQVIYNLVLNALQAMQKPGTVEVGCRIINDQYVAFWIQDEGAGMNDEVLHHLYEPFFTTKEKGTGLGLATSYKIIEAHHGEITVKSTVGTGTRFEIRLPRA